VSATGISLPLLRPVAAGPWRRRAALAALALALLAGGYWFWLRDSSLVAVRHVEVVGVSDSSAEGRQVRAALTGAAEEMTTLHVRPQLLEEAAARFPLVRSVSASPGFPNSLTVTVVERIPAALIGLGSETVAVADDGTILRGMATSRLELPRLPLDHPPKRDRVTGTVLEQAQVLGAAPAALRAYLDSSSYGDSGVTVDLVGGIELRFGSAARAGAKWHAAAAVLADPAQTALDYVDLSAPARPAVGGSGHLLPTAP
jgi:cell division protein FtsQ